MLDDLRFLTRHLFLGLGDRLIAFVPMRWNWVGTSGADFVGHLPEFRPIDRESAREMAQGRFLLAGKIVEAGGGSPFILDVGHDDWRLSLHGFAWLRHFREAREPKIRHKARALVLDWISRNDTFRADLWAPSVTSQRVMIWLRHCDLLIEGASPADVRTLAGALENQAQALTLRAPFAIEPEARLQTAIAQLALVLCSTGHEAQLPERFRAFELLLDQHFDADGLHRSRNARLHLQFLLDLLTLRHALERSSGESAARLADRLRGFHEAFNALLLGTGEPAFFNGASQFPRDVINAVQSQGPSSEPHARILSGYGIAIAGKTMVIADGGAVPPLEFAGSAHAGALGFEMSHGPDLLFGNCGPAPNAIIEGRERFRHGVAHSAPTINAISATALSEHGPFAGRLRGKGKPGSVEVDAEQSILLMRSHGYEQRFGVTLERRIALLSGGMTLVGQDRMIASRRKAPRGVIICRFHLGPGVTAEPRDEERIIVLRLPSGTVWSFLWQGADMRIEDSVRRSTSFGFHRTRQIVLEAPVIDGAEIAWIATQEGR